MTVSSLVLAEHLRAQPYRSYSYGYPHKTAYRRLQPATTLAQAWAAEPRRAVFGYLHLPFCEMRCGFCNLFTTANPREDLVARYLRGLSREAEAIRRSLPGLRAARLAIGGGTPTYLEVPELQAVLELMEDLFGVSPTEVPMSVETSPATATPDRLRLLREAGVRRISIGVQSFVEDEVHGAGRPQHAEQVRSALAAIRTDGPPVLNIDLMYGLDGQSTDSWLASLRNALAWQPEELFCYPLYVRRLTGLGRRERQVEQQAWDAQRLRQYRAGRDLLLANGYRQTSMRRFVRDTADAWVEPEYSCQTDGMVGLGCGARSYTRGLHYSREYAVGRPGVLDIIGKYCGTMDFTTVDYGIRLTEAEQRRRYVLMSILHAEGLDAVAFRRRFGDDPLHALPELADLIESELAAWHGPALRLTPDGLELSDAIGPWLTSPEISRLCAEFDWR